MHACSNASSSLPKQLPADQGHGIGLWAGWPVIQEHQQHACLPYAHTARTSNRSKLSGTLFCAHHPDAMAVGVALGRIKLQLRTALCHSSP